MYCCGGRRSLEGRSQESKGSIRQLQRIMLGITHRIYESRERVTSTHAYAHTICISKSLYSDIYVLRRSSVSRVTKSRVKSYHQSANTTIKQNDQAINKTIKQSIKRSSNQASHQLSSKK
jgi:iron-sulfur cluster repair protein YtfE (RIC family)